LRRGRRRSEPPICARALVALAVTSAMPGAVRAQPAFPPIEKLERIQDLPDTLLLRSGERVKTAKQWREKRRPELMALFQHYMYGHLLPAPARTTAQVRRLDAQFLGGRATLKLVTVTPGPEGTPPIDLLLIVPNARRKPAPAFLSINFCGNHALVADAAVPLARGWVYASCRGVVDSKATDASRGAQAADWAVEQTIARGYALASFYSGDVDPDRAEAAGGVHAHLKSAGGAVPRAHDRGTIAAWAWGLHRAVDYLASDRDVDRERIAVVGHSRNGKAALVAGAFDERIALVIPHQAGCGGTAPSRGTVGESVKQINDRFPHWFGAEFKGFNDDPARLPFDQHSLVALVAPRPVLLSNAVEDTWANPAGQFDVLRAAEPVYRLLGAGGLDAKAMPEPGKLVKSRLGYFIRPGKHSMTAEDWKAFLAFADAHLTTR
jgi:hypothetical protein